MEKEKIESLIETVTDIIEDVSILQDDIDNLSSTPVNQIANRIYNDKYCLIDWSKRIIRRLDRLRIDLEKERLNTVINGGIIYENAGRINQ